MPSPGCILQLYLPGGCGVRTDSAVFGGYVIPPFYDSMIVKLIVHAPDRASAVRKMISALGEVVVEGVDTNLDFQYDILTNDEFSNGYITTDFIPKNFPEYV